MLKSSASETSRPPSRVNFFTPNRKAAHSDAPLSVSIVITRFVIPILCLGSFVSCKNASPPPTTESQPGSHQKMLHHLDQLSRRASKDHPYLSEKNLRGLRQMKAEVSEETDVIQQWKISYNLGISEQAHGDDEAAVTLLEEAYQIIKTHPDRFTQNLHDLCIFQTGMAWLRLGETRNCCAINTPEACIIPLAPSALHTKTEGSTNALKYFKELIEKNSPHSPTRLRAQWLLNLAAHTLGRAPEKYALPADTYTKGADFPHFPNKSQELNLDTYSLSGGAIAEDFDNDGDIDLLVSGYAPDEQLRLHQNQGDGTFKEVTDQANLTGLYGGLNMVQGDYDNDGFTDVFILRGAWLADRGSHHPNSLLRNLGNGTFEDVTFAVGLGDQHYPTQTAAWADFDLDGDLDLYIGNETVGETKSPCQLFRNDGEKGFTDIAASAGVTNDGFSKAVVWGDVNNDRYPDLFVSNYSGANRLYLNQKNSTFTDIAQRAEVQQPSRSFPAWFWDYNNDGKLDLYVSGYAEPCIEHLASEALGSPIKTETQKLYQGDGQGGFREVSLSTRLRHPHNPMGANFGDINGDGFLDFYLGTGHPNFWELSPNAMYLNQDGRRFKNVSASGGFGHLQKGHAVVFADFDEDGDQDVFEQLGGAVASDKFRDAYFQNPGFENQWIKIRATGTTSNKSAIGTKITVHYLDASSMPREVKSKSSATSAAEEALEPIH